MSRERSQTGSVLVGIQVIQKLSENVLTVSCTQAETS